MHLPNARASSAHYAGSIAWYEILLRERDDKLELDEGGKKNFSTRHIYTQ